MFLHCANNRSASNKGRFIGPLFLRRSESYRTFAKRDIIRPSVQISYGTLGVEGLLDEAGNYY